MGRDSTIRKAGWNRNQNKHVALRRDARISNWVTNVAWSKSQDERHIVDGRSSGNHSLTVEQSMEE